MSIPAKIQSVVGYILVEKSSGRVFTGSQWVKPLDDQPKLYSSVGVIKSALKTNNSILNVGGVSNGIVSILEKELKFTPGTHQYLTYSLERRAIVELGKSRVYQIYNEQFNKYISIVEVSAEYITLKIMN